MIFDERDYCRHRNHFIDKEGRSNGYDDDDEDGSPINDNFPPCCFAQYAFD